MQIFLLNYEMNLWLRAEMNRIIVDFSKEMV